MALKRGVYAELKGSKTTYINQGKKASTTNGTSDTKQHTAQLGTCVLGKMILGK